MKILKYLLSLFLFICFFIAMLNIARIEIPLIKSIIGEYLYERTYFILIVTNFLLIFWILFNSKYNKKEKENYILMMLSIPIYNIFFILKKL
jgi:hypothetical protein